MTEKIICPCCGSTNPDKYKMAAFLIKMLMGYDPNLRPYLIREFHKKGRKEEK